MHLEDYLRLVFVYNNPLLKSVNFACSIIFLQRFVWSAFFTFLELLEKQYASIEDILLLFIYLELGAVVGIYFKTDHMPVRFLIYVAITALTRMLLEYLNEWHNSPTGQIDYEILIICGGIVLLAIGIIILRYASHNYPSNTNKK